MKRGLWPLLGLFLLSACGQKSVENLDSTISIQSNAYFVAFQDGGPDAPWQVRVRDNSDYSPLSRGVSVDDSSRRFGLVFVCPSLGGDDAHQVFLYLGVTSEIRSLDHTCRKADQDRSLQRIYGSVRGLAANDGINPGEMAMVALAPEVSLRAYEGYAAKSFLRRRDVLAFKGPLDPANNRITPKRFYRRLNTDKTELVRADIDFDDTGLTADVTGKIPGQVSIDGLQEGESLHAVVGFISEQGSFLPLTEATDSVFDYWGVPRLRKSGEAFYGDGEGHQLRVTVRDAQGQANRRLVVLFHQQQDVDVTIPRLPSPQARYTVSLRDAGSRREVNAQVPSYYDANYGAGILYRLDFQGQASSGGRPLQWTVYLTQQWLGSTPSLTLRLPSLVGLAGWDPAWEFKAATAVSSQLSTYASRAEAGEVLEYLRGGRFRDGLAYAEILQADDVP